MEELMLRVDHVSKRYVLGQIGSTTLKTEMQRRSAKRRGREDPTRRIGAKEYEKGETFLALDDVSFDVMKGERVGIIGRNGAGKSTLLKIISRVTAPTGGRIGLNGRVASMLEVGTGFHGELTGRENIYMNGAILGMTRKEIDAKMEDIIEFSECRQFIDTPVKRYSSGMYVKLAFSVAAHLDAEIMIMDEVLAVGDMAFQQKCLEKMSDVSKTEGRTILYVSHNMNTIRRLCDRCIVLDHGTVYYSGDVDSSVEVYMNTARSMQIENEFGAERKRKNLDHQIRLKRAVFLDKADLPVFQKGESIRIRVDYEAKEASSSLAFRLVVHAADGTGAGMATTAPCVVCAPGKNSVVLTVPMDWLAPGKYFADLVAYDVNQYGSAQTHDAVDEAFTFEKDMTAEENNHMEWHPGWWGYVMFPEIQVEYL